MEDKKLKIIKISVIVLVIVFVLLATVTVAFLGYRYLGFKDKSGDASVKTQEETIEPKFLALDNQYEVVGNATDRVTYNGNSYYWEYSDPNQQQSTFIIEDQSGNKQEMLDSRSKSDIYVVTDKIFVTQYDVSDNFPNVIVYDMDANQIEEKQDFAITGIDYSTGNLLMDKWYEASEGEHCIYNPHTDEFLDIEIPTYAKMFTTDYGIYYAQSDYDNPETVYLYMCDYEYAQFVEISNATVNDQYSISSKYANIYSLQETEQSIYYLYGYSDGSAGMYQTGGLCRIDKETFVTEEIAKQSQGKEGTVPVFYAFVKNGEEIVIYADEDDDYQKYTAYYNVTTGEKGVTDMMLGALNTPIYNRVYNDDYSSYKEVSYWIYPEADGEIVHIMDKVDVESIGDTYIYVENISYQGNVTYYDVDYHKTNDSPDSWRDATVTYKIESYMYNEETNEITLLNTVEY